MSLRTVRFISLLLTALLTGMLFCHVLELPNKMKLSPAVWLNAQQVLYNMFGPVASLIEPLAIGFTFMVLFMLRRRPGSAFLLTLIAEICLVVHLASWFIVVNPVNQEIRRWTPSSMPRDWTRARDRWEYGHAAGAALTLAALAALIAATLADTAES